MIFDRMFYRFHILRKVENQRFGRRFTGVALPIIPNHAVTLARDAYRGTTTSGDAASATNDCNFVWFILYRQIAIREQLIGIHSHHVGPMPTNEFFTIDEDFDFVIIRVRRGNDE